MLAFGDEQRLEAAKLQRQARFRERRYNSSNVDDLSRAANLSRRKSNRLKELNSSSSRNLIDSQIDSDQTNTAATAVHGKVSVVECFYTKSLPSRLVRSVATGISVTLLCTTDGRCYQFGSFGGIQVPPKQVPQLEGKVVVQVAVGCGVAKPSDTIEVAFKNKNYSSVVDDGDGASADDDFRSFDTEDHMAVLTSERESNLYTWGGNDHGQLGRGSKGDFGWRAEAVSFGSDFHERISYVVAGLKYTIAVTEMNQVYSWGINDRGQLGLGTFKMKANGVTAGAATSEFVNVTGDRDIVFPMSITQLNGDRSDKKKRKISKSDDVSGDPFGKEVFREEHVSGSTDVKYQRRQRLVAVGVSHSLLWNSVNELPPDTSSILSEREKDLCDLETANAMLQDRLIELSLLRSPEEEEEGMGVGAGEGVGEGERGRGDDGSSEEDEADESEQQKMQDGGGEGEDHEEKQTKLRTHDTDELKAQRRRQHLDKVVDSKVRDKKILMTLIGGASEDGTPADAATLTAVSRDKLVHASVVSLSSLEESIRQSRSKIEMIKDAKRRVATEVESVETRVTDSKTNVSVLQDFVEDVPRLAKHSARSSRENESSDVDGGGGNKDESKLGRHDTKKSEEEAAIMKGLIHAVAEDSSQLILSDRTILNHTEKDQDRLYRSVVMHNRDLVTERGVVSRLKEEYTSLLQVATSRAKIVMRQGKNVGVDAFDAAQMLEEVSSALKKCQPFSLMENKWQTSARGQSSTKVYEKAVRQSQRTSSRLLNDLSARMNKSHFVHEYGPPSEDPSMQQLKEALANTTPDGHLSQSSHTHAVERASVQKGGTSAAHELMKFGIMLLSDTLSIEEETGKIVSSLLPHPKSSIM